MVIKLYKADGSPPARACMMACDLLNVPVEMITMELMKGDHTTPEFRKKNPTHTVPVLEDGDLIILDSHAILMYLAEVYDKSNSLYPKDLKQRALVNQKLFLNSSILFARLRDIMFPLVIERVKPSEKAFVAVEESYGFLEEFLKHTQYLAGDNLTIADISAYATVSSLVFMLKLDGQKYPKLQAWLQEMDKLPCAQNVNAPRIKEYEKIYKNLMATCKNSNPSSI